MRYIANLSLSLVIAIAVLNSCKDKQEPEIDQTDSVEEIVDPAKLSGRDIVERSCRAHGGMDYWNRMNTIEFTKSTKLLFSDGSIESDMIQKQSFTFYPRHVYKIGYEIDSSRVSLIYDQGFIHKRVNGFPVNDSLEIASARSALLAAQFVVSQPFALLNEGVQLNRIEDYDSEGKTYYAVEATYPGDGPDSDKWTYYFDRDNFILTYNKVVLTDHTSWVENLQFDETTGMKFNAHRKSYRLNEKGEKTYLRAEYFYTDFKVNSR